MKRMNRILGLVLFLVLFEACSTVPIIGRKQLSLLPESQMVSLSLTSYREFLDSSVVITKGDPVKMVKNTGSKISASVMKFLRDNGLENRASAFSWEFNLVEKPDINAWCMPGGKVVFYSGILPVCLNEAGVATVMGHEIAHAVAQHGNERMSQGLIAQLGGMALDLAIQNEPEQTRNIFLNAYGIGSQLGVILPYSRKHEYEADKLGLIFMSMAGYDPSEALRFWERMAALGGTPVPEFLSTHPLTEKRIEELRNYLPEALKYKP
ncbi:MAG TPA: M48 family metallopeptidase [Prolixibacteraceae bacterium]|nr:M48 family metallopeptidase [Prolixibacteraceae bacterium]